MSKSTKNTKSTQVSGKRKRAVARATIKKGTGRITINKFDYTLFGTPLARERIREPLILAGDDAKKYDINVNVDGGGTTGQADAIRLSIARALVTQKAALKNTFSDYDRTLLVADVRYKESAKPNSHGKARAKRQKSYR